MKIASSKFIKIIAALVLLMSAALCQSVSAQLTFGQFNYEVKNDGTIEVFGNRKDLGVAAVNIPDTIDGKAVTSIGLGAFTNYFNLSSVTIPDGVTSIGKSAFAECFSLTSVTIPDSVTSIGDDAFVECESLTSVTIPKSVTSIGEAVFEGCGNLTSIIVASTNPSFSSLSGVLFDKEKTRLIQCPGGFSGSFTIPISVTIIDLFAFAECSSLTSIIVAPANSKYSSLDGVLFNKGQTRLIQCPGGFSGSYIIPNSVTIIGEAAFEDCEDLTSVTIPNSVTSIGDYGFVDCDDLASINVESANPNFSSLGGVLFNKSQTSLIQCPAGFSGSYIIPNSVTIIGEAAFEDCEDLTSVTIPNSVISIGDYAFEDCHSLISVTIPSSVTSIGDDAFEDCDGLRSVTFLGDAPANFGENRFQELNGFTFYYLSGSNGFTSPTWRGYPSKELLFTLTPNTQSAASEGGANTVKVTSNIGWSWKSDAGWVTSTVTSLQTGTQNFSYAVAENTSTSQRTGTITFVSSIGGIAKTLEVTQAAATGGTGGTGGTGPGPDAPANDITKKFQPKSPNEPALRLAVPAGKSRTVIARGANGTEGIALIEFNLLSNSDSSGTAPLANLSTRGNIGTGDNILIAGVVIQGSGTKRVLVTGRGASVPVSGNIANTQLRVVNQATKQVIASSDDYSSESQYAAIRAAGKARTIVDSDAAVILDLAAGAYTVLVSGTGEATGVGIVEIFDINPASSARIVNLSTRGRVGTGDNVMIGGLIAGGNSGEFAGVIARVTSPSSAAYDRKTWLADPNIEVFDGPNKVLENDDWTTP